MNFCPKCGGNLPVCARCNQEFLCPCNGAELCNCTGAGNQFDTVPSESELRDLVPVGWGEIEGGNETSETEPKPYVDAWTREARKKSYFQPPDTSFGSTHDGQGLYPRDGY